MKKRIFCFAAALAVCTAVAGFAGRHKPDWCKSDSAGFGSCLFKVQAKTQKNQKNQNNQMKNQANNQTKNQTVTQKKKNPQESTDHQTEKPVMQFGYQLLGQYLKKENQKNPVLSPVSAYLVLSLAGNGAKGETKKEFQNVLGRDMLSVSKELTDILRDGREGIQLTSANSVWMDGQFTPKKKWLDTAKGQFQADVFQRNLSTEAVKDEINQWVSDRTSQKIPKLLDKKLEKDMRLALLNALYFHADWKQPFYAEMTVEQPFLLDNGNTVKTEMMNASIRNCGYLKDGKSEGVVLPYKDGRFAFVAVKPVGKESIREWYASYTAESLASFIQSGTNKEADVSLPKFTARCKMDLKNGLKKTGLKRVFDVKKADLTLLGSSKDRGNLYLSMILQEAVISVAEKGTEAAAATMGGIAAGTALIVDKPQVRFDRSFLYAVMDMETGVPLFMGIADQPDE